VATSMERHLTYEITRCYSTQVNAPFFNPYSAEPLLWCNTRFKLKILLLFRVRLYHYTTYTRC